MVPHLALMHKLRHHIGVGDNACSFFDQMFRNAKACPRSGDLRRDTVRIEAGVPQGAPSSPLLFVLFINDILDDMKAHNLGVEIPSGSQSKTIRQYICGLLYADDTVLLTSSQEDMVRVLAFLTKWLENNGLSVNASKCAIMLVTCPGDVIHLPVPLRDSVLPVATSIASNLAPYIVQ